MKAFKMFALLGLSLTTLTINVASHAVEMTAEEAKAKVFSDICDTKFEATITMENTMGHAYWGNELRRSTRNTPKKVDQLIADTTQVCLDMEQPLKDALNEMKDNWFKVCKAEACKPSYSSNTNEGESNCWGGDVTVTNRHNTAEKCTYSVYQGHAEPKPIAEMKSEDPCYYAGTDEYPPGYLSATVNIPSTDVTPQLYMNLDCRAPIVDTVVEDDDKKDDPQSGDDGEGDKSNDEDALNPQTQSPDRSGGLFPDGG